jgi:hypothetical protein
LFQLRKKTVKKEIKKKTFINPANLKYFPSI